MQNIEQEILYRVPNLMEILGVKRSTVWLYAKQGKLKPIKLSPRVTVFKKSDIDAFIASRMGEVAS